MHHANLAWITERDLKNYYVLRSTHRGACYELEYPLRGWPESFLSSNWERDVRLRDLSNTESEFSTDDQVWARPHRRVDLTAYTPQHYPLSTPRLHAQPLVELGNVVGAMGVNLRSLNQQYFEMIQNISRVATSQTYREPAGIGIRRVIEPAYEREEYGGGFGRHRHAHGHRRKRRMDRRYSGYVVRD